MKELATGLGLFVAALFAAVTSITIFAMGVVQIMGETCS